MLSNRYFRRTFLMPQFLIPSLSSMRPYTASLYNMQPSSVLPERNSKWEPVSKMHQAAPPASAHHGAFPRDLLKEASGRDQSS